MMLAMTDKQLRSVTTLKGSEQFDDLMEWLKTSMDDIAYNSISIENETQLRWNQGKMQILLDIQTKIEHSGIIIDGLQETRSKPKIDRRLAYA